MDICSIEELNEYQKLCNMLIKKGNEVAVVYRTKPFVYNDIYSLINTYEKILRRYMDVPAIIFKAEPSPNMIALILAAIKVKKPFVPVNFNANEKRTSQICSIMKVNGYFYILEDNLCFHLDNNCSDYYNAEINYDEIAYVIFTSGSTGKPKGVKISYKALFWFLCDITKIIDFSDCKNYLWLSNINFDISLLEIFAPIIYKRTIHIAEKIEHQIPKLLIKKINKYRIDFIQITPSQYELLKLCNFESLIEDIPRVMLFGGESMRMNQIRGLLNKNIDVYNMYGPTETTIWCSSKLIKSEKELSIGNGFGHNKLIIFYNGKIIGSNENKEGELLVSGMQLFSGYVEDSQNNNNVLVLDGKEYYKTGDIARFIDENNIVVLGRIDNQIKINGVRIELEDIENTIEGETGIKIVALFFQDSQRIVIICEEHNYYEELLSDINRIIDSYFSKGVSVNSIFSIKRFPLNKNMKVDRSELKEWCMKKMKYIKNVNGI